MQRKQDLIESLTGIKSSKKSYYTELKKTMAQMQKKNAELAIINDMMKSFDLDMSIDSMLKNLLEKLKPIFRLSRLSFAMLEDSQLVLKNVYPTSSFLRPVGCEIHDENSLYWQVIKEKRIICRTPENKHMGSYLEEKAFEQLQIKSNCVIPLISRRSVIGVLCLGSKENITFHEADLAFFQHLADQFAVCIENSRLYHAVVKSKKEWEDTFHGVQDLLIVVDKNGVIQRFNAAVSKLLQLPDQQINGRTIQSVFSLSDDENQELLRQSHLKASSVSKQIRLKNDRIFAVSISPVYHEETQDTIGSILNMKDVTERVHMESQLMQSAKLAAIGEMAAGVAHELNSPLTAILGNSQLLMRKLDKQDQPYRMVEAIYNCGERSKKIIRNLLTFSRQDDLRFETCSVNLAVEQVISLTGYQIERQNIQLNKQLNHDIPFVEGNMQQIEQIVINLLMNAKDELEACTHSNKNITIKTSVQERGGSSWVMLSVSDNGRGIPVEKQDDIFYPFYTTKEAMKGTGLGLSVSLGIAKSHGGILEICNREEQGSCFCFMIPSHTKKENGEDVHG